MTKFNLVAAFVLMVSSFALISCGTEAKAEISPDISGTEKAHTTVEATANDSGLPTTSISFNEAEFDFGSIETGEKATHTYTFKNTGNEPLIISKAKGSCGCTVPTWPKEPIAVGESGEITVVFNSKGKTGKQSKRVTLTANTTPSQSFLTIKGEVTGDPKTIAKK